MSVANRVQLPKASDFVVASLRKKILAERLEAGTRLPSVDELMAEYGLGRVTVREALRILENDGLIDMRRGPSGGVFVRQIDIRQVSEALGLLFNSKGTTVGELADFRLLMEPEVARLAALNATPSEKEMLLRDAENELEASQSISFHSSISSACGNSVYELVMNALHSPLSGHFRHNLISHENEELTVQAHIKIAKHIATGDAAGAERAMRRHLEAYKKYVLDYGLQNESIFPIG